MRPPDTSRRCRNGRRAPSGAPEGVSSGAFSAALAQHHQRLRAAGFSVFPSQVAPDPTAALLRSLYPTLQISQLLGGGDD